MTGSSNSSVGWKWWLGWVGVNILGCAVGMLISFLLAGFIGDIAAFAVFGALLGLAQWTLLRRRLQQSYWWIVAGALSAPLGLFLANWGRAVIPLGWYYMILGFAFCGLVIGIFQAIVLQSRFGRALLWTFVSALGWALGGLASRFLILPLPPMLMLTLDYALVGALTGMVTGLFLYFHFKAPSPLQAEKAPPIRGLLVAVGISVLISVPLLLIHNPYQRFDVPSNPEFGEIPTCTDLPPLECSGDPGFCTEIVPFEPVEGPGYVNFPENGETWEDQYRSYLRRDLKMLIQYAAARVACETANWEYASARPLGLIDMSEIDGAIPGTSVGAPGHPAETHTDGKDIDVAYYRVELSPSPLGGGDEASEIEANRPGSVCRHIIFGIDVNHCTQPPHLLDPWRTALFIKYVSQHPNTRVIGVDGQVGDVLIAAFDDLIEAGWHDPDDGTEIPLAFEVVDEGWGWYLHHHHHIHISILPE
jgi:hypothetical protein